MNRFKCLEKGGSHLWKLAVKHLSKMLSLDFGFLPRTAAIITRFELMLCNCSQNIVSKIKPGLISPPPSHSQLLTLICGR